MFEQLSNKYIMQRLSRQVLTEVLWLSISLVLSVILAFMIFGKMLFSGITDLHFHDTYFVLAGVHALPPVFLVVTFAVYVVKVFRDAFKQVLANWILVLTGVAAIIMFAFFIKWLSMIFTGGWTSYPPLSALGDTQLSQPTLDTGAGLMITCLSVIQFAILVILLYATYRWGKSKNS
jgi:hypothetical protein